MGANSSLQRLAFSPQSPQAEGEWQPGRAGAPENLKGEPADAAKNEEGKPRPKTESRDAPDPANQALKGPWVRSRARRG